MDVELPLRAQVGGVEIIGRVDRLERGPDGRAIVVDLKTGSTPVPAADLDRHPQLGVYQLAVLLGAFERYGLTEPGGGEVSTGVDERQTGRVRVVTLRAVAGGPAARSA